MSGAIGTMIRRIPNAMYSRPLAVSLTSPRFPMNNNSGSIIMILRVRQQRNLTIVPFDQPPMAQLDRGIANSSVEDMSYRDIRLNGNIRDQWNILAGCCSHSLARVFNQTNAKPESVERSFIRMANPLTHRILHG